MRIVLLGYMGSGKIYRREIAWRKSLNFEFVDLDDYIETVELRRFHYFLFKTRVKCIFEKKRAELLNELLDDNG